MKNREGFALIAALWFAVLLSGIALEFALTGRDIRASTINARDGDLARAAADAGLEQARALLTEELRTALRRAGPGNGAAPGIAGDPWRDIVRLLPETLLLGSQRYRVELADADAKLNVNTATEEELRRLFVALRIDARQADRMAQAISDWKDPDDLHRARGAEYEAYLSAGAPILPANGPFRDVSEIRWILGMTAEAYSRAGPRLTTVGSGRVNLRTADRAVLLALPGMTEEAVALVMRLRRDPWRALDIGLVQQSLSPSAKAIMLPHLPALGARTLSTTTEVEVHSTGWTEYGRVQVLVSALIVRADDEILTGSRRVR